MEPQPLSGATAGGLQQDGITAIDKRLAADREYWLEKLAGDLSPVGFPADYTRRPGESARERLPLALPEKAAARLVVICGGRQELMLAALVATTKILLHRYTGVEDIVVGTTVHGRRAEVAEWNRLLALRDDLAPGATVREVLGKVKRTLAEAYEHQKFPFPRLLGLLNVERRPDRPSLFAVAVVLESINDGRHLDQAVTDALLVFDDSEGHLTGSLEYNAGLYSRAAMKVAAEHFGRLLEAVVNRPDARLDELDLMDEGERERRLVAFNLTAREYPREATVHQLFVAQARRTPEAPAVGLGGTGLPALTYRELADRAGRLSRTLRRAGVAPGTRVAILLEHSVDVVAAVLAVLEAGATYVPLDPEHPEARLAYVLTDSGACLVLTSTPLVERLPEGAREAAFRIDSAREEIGREPAAEADAGWSGAPAYVIYTSGSTGRPKGVEVSHRSLINYVAWAQEAYLRGEILDFPLYTSLSFDLTKTSLFVPLLSGGCLWVYPRRRQNEYPLLELLADDRVDIVKLTPSHLELIRERDNRGSRVRRLIVGGEALSSALAADIADSFGGRVEIFNEYGPTEATVGCTLHRFTTEDRRRAFVPIGAPAANVALRVLDAALAPVADGQTGELYIAGDGVALGYLGRPELTAERFVPDPHQPGSRMYRSGDLVRWIVAGGLEFVGRRDEQVKVRGFRIELGEIRGALNRHPAVGDSVVILTRESQEPTLVAYYAARREIAEADLRDFLAQSLLPETIPAIFVHLRRLPLTLNAKVDLRALPSLAEVRERLRPGYVAPRSEAEKVMAEIWRSVLGVPQVGLYDNFFQLGGDSIIGIRVIARANQAGYSLVPRQLFECQTVAALTAAAGEVRLRSSEQGIVSGGMPLTPIQAELLKDGEPHPEHYNQALLLTLRQGSASAPPAAWGAAVQRLLTHHDALRLRFAPVAGGWTQGLDAPQDAPPFTWIDLSPLPPEEQAVALEAAAAVLQTSLDLARGPLLRAVIFASGGQAARLFFVIHHLAVDGVSWRVLLEDLDAALAGRELPAKTCSFRRWALELERLARAGAFADEIPYWQALARQVPPPLPVDFPGGSNRLDCAREVSVALDREETRALLQDIPKAYGSQINDALLMSLVEAFAAWLGERRLFLALEGHGREELVPDLDLSRTVGWFTAVFPVLLDLREAPEIGEALQRVGEQLAAIPRRGVGFGALRHLAETAAAEAVAALPEPEVSFNYLGRFDDVLGDDSPFAPARESTGSTRHPARRRRHLLEVDALVGGGTLRIRFTYSERLHHRERVTALAESFAERLRALVAHCRSRSAAGPVPEDFPLARLGREELQRLAAGREIEDLYPLSPLQEGLLFHSLATAGTDVYFRQLRCTLAGDLDVDAFAAGCQDVLESHSILRTAFVWEGLDASLQMVLRHARLPLHREDWRHLPADVQRQRLEELAAADRRRGFSLGEAPLMRLALLRFADDRHWVLWSFHHLISDGWSFPLLVGEILRAYSARCDGRPLRRQPARPFRDYIAWLVEQDLATAERFWRRELEGFTAPTPLALDREVRGDETPVLGDERQRFAFLPEADTQRLMAWARAEQLTANSAVQGAWALLLARYSGETDIVFGAVSSGRSATLPGIESMLGVFINTLPVRARMVEGLPLADWLRAHQQRQAAARDYEHSPLAQVQGWSEVPRGQPLFLSLLAFENYPVDTSLREQGGSLKIEEVEFPEATHYPLTLMMAPAPALPVRLIYDRRRCEPVTAERLLHHFLGLLATFPDHAGPATAVALLSAAERHQLLLEWNDTAAALPEDLIHPLFEVQAARAPQRPAVLADGASLTYGELNQRSNRLAHLLHAAGCGRGSLVAVYLERSPDMVSAVLGVLKAGAAYVPLDADYPAGRVEWILGALGIRCLLTQSSRLPTLAEMSLPSLTHLVCLDEPSGTPPPAFSSLELGTPRDLARQRTENPEASGRPEDTAYIIFTSGSSGTPKGVVLRHRPVVNLIRWVNDTFAVGEDDRVLFITSLCFDLSVYDIFGLLAAGGTVRVATRDQVRDPRRLLGLLCTEPITFWDSAPASLQQLVPFLDEVPEGAAACRLRRVFLSGDWIPLGLPDAVRGAFPAARVIALGGATEAAIWSNSFPVGAVGRDWASIPYGRPIRNARYHVLDSRLEPCPVGAPGDLYIAGDCLAAGYAREPGLTAERFLPDPWSSRPGGRLYATGDRARYRADGNLEFLGRRDQQVKIRGFRIELGEIESVLGQHPEVREAVVVVREDEPAHRRLVAYLVPRQQPAPPPQELRHFLAQRLPDYMLPVAFVDLEAWPVTANGKLDRRALPTPEAGRAAPGYAAPRSTAERQLAAVWADVLRVPQVGLHDNFFELGGDSILSIQIVSRAAQAGLRLAPNQIFEHPTLAELAASASSAVPAQTPQTQVTGAVPLTPAQHWFFEAEPADPHHFNQSLFLELRRGISPAVLAAALAQLARHHDALRLRFRRTEEGWTQSHAEDSAEPPVTVLDLSGVAGPEQAACVERAAAQAQTSLDLAGPLLRAVLFRPGRGRSDRLLLVVHHLLVDGVSWRILLEDLAAACEALAAGAKPALPPKTTSFQRWSELLTRHARSAAVAAELPFWTAPERHEAAGLPVDFPEGRDTVAATEGVTVSFDREETRALLERAAGAHRSQLQELLLAAVAGALARWTGSPLQLLEVEGHGREPIGEEADLSRTVGWFTTFSPLLLDLRGVSGPIGPADPFALLRHVKEHVRSVPGRGLAHGLLRHLAEPEIADRLRSLPQPEVSFNYLGRLDQALPDGAPFALAPESAGPAESPRQRRRYRLIVNAAVLGGELRTMWLYSRNSHRRDTVEALAADFGSILRALLAEPRIHTGALVPSDFPLAGLSAGALEGLVASFEARIEDIYPLAPLQEGLLFHALERPPEEDLYFEQLTCRLVGELDTQAFRNSWRQVAARHPILRSAFVWAGLPEPLQVVCREAEPEWENGDWSDLPEVAREARLTEHLVRDRARGLALVRAPLMRFSLFRLAQEDHRFVWSFHHLLLDGWSLSRVLSEVFATYQALRAGREPDLPQPRPYRDYVAWVKRRDLAAGETFWRRQLAGLTAPTPLGGERGGLRPSGPPRKEDFGERESAVSPAATAALEEAARRCQVTLNTMIQGAWALLLERYSGSGDILFGAVSAGRPAELEGAAEMVGLFINTLPVRIAPLAQAEVQTWLQELQARYAESRVFEHCPLSRIQRWSELPPGEPLFESLLVFENYPAERAAASNDGLGVRDFRFREVSNYPLTLIVLPGERLRIRAVFDARRFDPVDVDRRLTHLSELLASLRPWPGLRLSDLTLLSPAERHQLLVEWSDTASAFPAGRCVHELFEEQAARRLDAIAVVLGESRLTYGELDRRSSRLAVHLRRLGVGPEVRVGVLMERSLDLPTALLGVLKAGGAFVPIDLDYPPERIALLLADAACPLVLTQRRWRDRLAPGIARVLVLDEETDSDLFFGGGIPDGDLAGRAGPENLAYVMFTSGSTGRPKGVAVSHRAIVRLVRDTGYIALGEDEVFLQLAPISFDASTLEIWGPLLNGGRLVLYPPRKPDLDELADLLTRQGVTTLWLTAGLFHLMAEERPEGLDPVRQLLAGGDVLSVPLVEKILRRGAVGRLVNGYGPTESTTFACCHVMTSPEGLAATVPIGRPIANTQLRVLGADGEPVPAGVAGELFLAGPGLARGYLGDAAQTAARYVPAPPPAEPGERLFRTGDLVRYRGDGLLEFLGRIDQQVKIRGFRIEPGEIEAALERHPAVSGAVVLARGGAEKSLVAYFTSPASPLAHADELRAFLWKKLPAFMIPSAFIRLESFPLTPNGKVDRGALPETEWRKTEESSPAPRTPVEEVLAGIWAEVLGLERVGAADHFFDLGGHSLLATQVMSRLRSVFAIELPLRVLFESPILAELAAQVEATLRTGAGGAAPPLVPMLRQGALPLSFAQRRLWFIDQLAPDSPLYNIPVALQAKGPLDPGVLAASLGEIVRRHEALRTVFFSVEGSPVQVIQPAAPFTMPLVDLAGLPESRREALALALTGEEASRPFDLTRGPLLRGALLRLGEGDHIALLTLHHIASDGWSMGILVHELMALYAAFAEGRPSPLSELPVQYADFAAWQLSWLQGKALDNEVSYWQQQLAGLPPRLELPTDRPRPAVQSFRGASRETRLSAELTRQVHILSRREGATPFMVLLAGFEALLARYSGQEDLAVGTPIAGRNRLETEGLIGFFVNTLVLRGNLHGEPSFRELLGRVRDTALAAHTHQDVPFEKLVEELAPERSLAYAPLFQVMFVLQNAPLESLEIQDLLLRPVSRLGTTAKFDLTLALEEHAGELIGGVEYAADLFERATIERLIVHFECLLTAALAAPGRTASSLPLMSPAEREQLLRQWNDTQTEGLAEGLVHQDVATQAARRPSAVAVEAGVERWTYRRLVGSARRLARHLRELGVGPDAIVGLCAERSPAMVVGMLAVLEAGGAYLPLDPTYPAERLTFLLEDSGAHVLLAQDHLIEQVPADHRRVVPLDARWDCGEDAGEPLDVEVSPDNLAYVIYTSGSTGHPKGVMVPHRGVRNRLRWAQEVYRLDERDAVLQKASFSFDFSVWECFAPLSAGARLILAEPGRQGDGPYLVRLLREQRVTFVHFIPSMLAVFLGEEGVEECVSLRQVFAGGEPLTPDLRDRALARLSAPLDNQYGPTEISIDTTRWICAPGKELHRVPIGRPIANSRLYVVDPELRPVPVGVAGELLVGGAGVTRGYLRRPALTAERFVPDPFGSEPGARLYRTGDLARWLSDGTLEYRGRIDFQVKVRGFRIEPGEIEAVLVSMAGVREAVVTVHEDASGDRRLVAYVTGETSTESLRLELHERLPEYMVPAFFVHLPALPLSPNGKVDRNVLPAPEWRGSPEGWLAPRTPVEEVLAGIWAEVLRVERVGAADHFFHLGGHSLLATQVMSRLRSAFAIELPLRDLFEVPTLAELAGRVEAALRAGAVGAAPPLVPAPRHGALPLSFAQQRLWFIDQLEPGTSLYNMPAALRAEGTLDSEVLALCLGEIVRRHETLRTVFAMVGDSPVQVIQPAAPFRLALVDLSGLPENEREGLAHTLVSEEAARPFDLARDPLLRGVLLRLAPPGEQMDHIIALTMHHITSDGWSTGILVHEIKALYAAFVEGRPSPLPELPVQYADFAVWQHSWLRGEVLEGEIAFWRRQLADLPPLLELPTDRPRPGVQSFRGTLTEVRLPAELTQQAHALNRSEGTTLFMLLLAGFQILMARYSRQEDFALGTPVAGRNRMEIEGLIGFFVNTLVLRGNLAGEPSFRELLGRVRETALAAHTHQDVPFEKLVQELTPERSLAQTPLFQVMFALQNAPGEGLEIPGLRLEQLGEPGKTSKFDLTLSLSEWPGGLRGAVEYATDLFDAATIGRLIDHFERLLTAALAEPDRLASELPLLSPAEHGQVVAEWNDTWAETPRESLYGLFETQARRTPEAVAVVFGTEELTYAGLAARSGRLARRLRRLGVGPDVLVG
ncbi:MAG TPA: non-ribosomal peptide synthase/polyketide synthase, partial [Thermoanaerobaculia bacterium]|nr:non-ribosomal peptide synthase/polyketide synthase [Thermoanaerobaculia bacterium]